MEESDKNIRHEKSIKRTTNVFFAIAVLLLIVITIFLTNVFYKNEKGPSKAISSAHVINLVNIKDAKVVKDYEPDDTVDSFDYIEFGKYNNKPIEWLVLKADRGEALVVSKYVLKSIPFAKEDSKKKLENWWNISEIKKWLNEEFYDEAFDDTEKDKIIEKKSFFSFKKKDKITILDDGEIKKYFGTENKELVKNHTKAKLFPGEKDDNIDVLNDYVPYWTRSVKHDRVSVVKNDGDLNADGYKPTYNKIGVRPAIYIKY